MYVVTSQHAAITDFDGGTADIPEALMQYAGMTFNLGFLGTTHCKKLRRSEDQLRMSYAKRKKNEDVNKDPF